MRDRHVVKILDFGLARLIPDRMTIDPETSVQLTGQGIIGTPHFMAPEQVRHSHGVDIADIYSLGCTFYFLLAGRAPFHDARNAHGVMVAQMTQDPRPLSEFRADLPPGLPEIIARMMEKDPNDRFQTPIELESALMMLLNGLRSSPPRPSQPVTPAPPPAMPTPRPSYPARTLHCDSCDEDVYIPVGIAGPIDFCPHCRAPFDPFAPEPRSQSSPRARQTAQPGPRTPQSSMTTRETTAPAPEIGEISGIPDIPEGWSVRFGDIGLACNLLTREWGVWFLSTLLYLVACVVAYFGDVLLSFLLLMFNVQGVIDVVIGGGVFGLLGACMIGQALRQIDGEEVRISDFFRVKAPWPNIAAIGILTSPITYYTIFAHFVMAKFWIFGLLLIAAMIPFYWLFSAVIQSLTSFVLPLAIDGRAGIASAFHQAPASWGDRPRKHHCSS